MGCFIILLKLNGKLLEKQTWFQRITNKQKYQYLNFKVSWHDQRGLFLLMTTGLKQISIQEKRIFTTGYFNNKFLVNTTPIKLYFMFPLEVPKKLTWLISILMTLQSNTFNMTKTFVYSVTWYLLCLIPDNMFPNGLLSCSFNHLFKMYNLVVWIGSSLKIKLWQIV